MNTHPKESETFENVELQEVPYAIQDNSGYQSNRTKSDTNNSVPNFYCSRFKKSKGEWFGEFVGIGIFAFILHLLVKFCFTILICLFCLPVCAQQIKRMPVVKSKINQQQINMIGQKVHQQKLELKKKQELLRNINVSPSKIVIRQIEQDCKKIRKIFEEYDVLLLPSFEDIRNRKQLYDSAFICLSMADTLNYIKYLKRSVSARYPLAMYAYGLSILEGVGLKSNKEIGLYYINMASDFNCPEATYYIGQLHDFEVYGYKKDSVMALKYYEKSAEQGGFDGAVDAGDRYYNDGDTIKAIKYWKQAYDLKRNSLLTGKEKSTMVRVAYNLGYFSYCGLCVPQDQKTGIDYLKYAAIWGNPDANYFLGLLYAEGCDYVSQNDKMSREYIQSSAKLGCVDGMVLYGNYCMMGYGMEKDSVEAVYWYKNAAQQRHVGAMCILPSLYFNAHENDSTILWGTKPECRDSADIQFVVGAAYYVKEDYENAEAWWKKAAIQKYPDALWWMYYLCEVHKNDSVLAIEYLKQAVDAKYPEALNEMGCNFANGDMVGKDVEKAKQLFHEAGSLGFGEAYNNLGNLYSNKDYIKKPNWEIAAEYYRLGAEMNNPAAQYNYGMCLKKGKGVKKDKQAAVYWLTLAAQNGNEDAIKEL